MPKHNKMYQTDVKLEESTIGVDVEDVKDTLSLPRKVKFKKNNPRDGFLAELIHHPGNCDYQEDAWSLHHIEDDAISSLTIEDIQDAIEKTHGDIYNNIARSGQYEDVSSTLSFIIMTKKFRIGMNFGDSGMDVDLGAGMKRWLMPHTVECEREYIEDNGGVVSDHEGCLRINFDLDVGRAYGHNRFYKFMDSTLDIAIQDWSIAKDNRVILYTGGNLARDSLETYYNKNSKNLNSYPFASAKEFALSYYAQELVCKHKNCEVYIDNFTSMHLTRPAKDNIMVCAGVYDGHGGEEVSAYLAEHFPKRLQYYIRQKLAKHSVQQVEIASVTEISSDSDNTNDSVDEIKIEDKALPRSQNITAAQRESLIKILNKYRPKDVNLVDHPEEASCFSFFTSTKTRVEKVNIMYHLKKDLGELQDLTDVINKIHNAAEESQRFSKGKLDKTLDKASSYLERIRQNRG